MNIQEILAQIKTVRDGQIRRLIAEDLHGKEHDVQAWVNSDAELEALFPQAAGALGWDWKSMSMPGRLRLATPNMTEVFLKALNDKIGGLNDE